jgi:hypothetical protein
LKLNAEKNQIQKSERKLEKEVLEEVLSSVLERIGVDSHLLQKEKEAQ